MAARDKVFSIPKSPAKSLLRKRLEGRTFFKSCKILSQDGHVPIDGVNADVVVGKVGDNLDIRGSPVCKKGVFS